MTMQHAVLRQMKVAEMLSDRGLLARFLFVHPRSRFGTRTFKATPVTRQVTEKYEAMMMRLLLRPCELDEDGESVPHIMAIDEQAIAVLEQLHDELEPRLGDGGDLQFVRGWAAKLVGAVGRIAALLHMCKYSDELAPWTRKIDANTMTSATAIGQYLIPHAVATLLDISESVEVRIARSAISWVRRHGNWQFSEADLYRALRRNGRVSSAEDLAQPLDLLVRRGYVRQVRPQRMGNRGRPPSLRYIVNPVALGHIGAEGNLHQTTDELIL